MLPASFLFARIFFTTPSQQRQRQQPGVNDATMDIDSRICLSFMYESFTFCMDTIFPLDLVNLGLVLLYFLQANA